MRRGAAGAAIALLLVPPLASRNEAAVRPLTVSEYEATLARLERSAGESPANARTALDDLPAAWRVGGHGDIFEIPTAPIAGDLRAWRAHADSAARDRMIARLQTLERAAARYRDAPADGAGARTAIASILAQPEFRGIHGPTRLDRLRQRILRFLDRWLGRTVSTSVIPNISAGLVYLLAALAALAGLWSLRTRYRRRPGPVRFTAASAVAAPESWSSWLERAQSAARRSDWRDAVHQAYWCAASFLESTRRWRPDPARTPRERVRLLPPGDEAEALADLTRRSERVWYGTADADASDYADVLEDLKRLGCPVS